MEVLIATDQSSQVLGLSIFEIRAERLLFSTAIQIKGKSLEARISTIKSIVNEYITKYSAQGNIVSCIVFEGVQMQKNNVLTLQILSELLGVCKNNAYEKEIPFLVLRPSEWRGHFHLSTGKKKREELKMEAVSFVEKRFELKVSDDEAEAILIGLCACHRINAEDTCWGAPTQKANDKNTKSNRKLKEV